MDIPADRLDEATLRAIAEEFVTREGTDYGDREFTLDEKVSRVLLGIGSGDVRIVFDPATDSLHLLPRD